MGNEVGEVVDKKNKRREEKDGANITNDNLAMEIIQFRYKDVDKKRDYQKDAADASADSVIKSQNRRVLVKETFWFIFKTLCMSYFYNLLSSNTLQQLVQTDPKYCPNKSHQ